MKLSTYVRVVLLAGAILAVSVFVNQILVGAIVAVLLCLVMIALNLRRITKFKSWISQPFAPPTDDLGEYYRPAKKLHTTLFAGRKRTRTLINTAQKFKHIANNLPDALVVLNDRMMIEAVNRSATSMLGLTPQDVGKPIATLIRHPDAQVLFKSDTDEVLWSDIPSPVSGDTQVELRLFPVSNKETMVIARDVSEMGRLLRDASRLYCKRFTRITVAAHSVDGLYREYV